MIIGFTGKAQSGKTTACTHIVETLRDVTKIGFKDALVEEMKKNFPDLLEGIINQYHARNAIEGVWDDGWDVRRLFEDKPPLMRALMQNYGTDVRRGDNPEYWTKQWKAMVAQTEGHIVCDDVRFLNEADAIRDVGGIIVKIVRTDITDTGNHISETEMDKIIPHYVIKAGKGELAKLYKELQNIYELE